MNKLIATVLYTILFAFAGIALVMYNVDPIEFYTSIDGVLTSRSVTDTNACLVITIFGAAMLSIAINDLRYS